MHGTFSFPFLLQNKMYFPCCRPKSVSHENLHEEDGGDGGRTPTVPRRPNPLIVGLANHLREHHSSARNSAVAGCFGFSDSPPRYEDIYVEVGGPPAATSKSRRANAPPVVTVSHLTHHHYHPEGIFNEDGTKEMMAQEGISLEEEEDDFDESHNEVPPPSYEESVTMSNETTNCVVVTITIWAIIPTKHKT